MTDVLEFSDITAEIKGALVRKLSQLYLLYVYHLMLLRLGILVSYTILIFDWLFIFYILFSCA